MKTESYEEKRFEDVVIIHLADGRYNEENRGGGGGEARGGRGGRGEWGGKV